MKFLFMEVVSSRNDMYDFLLLLIYRFNELVVTKLQLHAFFSLETKLFFFFLNVWVEGFFVFVSRDKKKNDLNSRGKKMNKSLGL